MGWKGNREYELPVIPQRALDDYLGRQFKDYSFMKQVPKAELRAYANELGFHYLTEPRTNQLVCNIISAQEPRWLYLLDMGAGKSKAAFDCVRRLKRLGMLQRALFTAPEFVHIDALEEQLQEHAPDLKYVKLLGDRSERFDLIDKKADIYFINNAGLQVYMSERKQSKGKGTQVVSADSAAEFAALFNIVHFDEIHRVSSHDSLTFKLMCWISAGAAFVSAGTGTPFGRDPMMLWPQFKIVDDGATFGLLGMFRAALFAAKKRYIGKRFTGYDYSFREERAPELGRMLLHRSIVYEEHELDGERPKVTYLRVPVRMTREQRMYYDRIRDRMKEVKGDFTSLDNIFTRFRQAASGFLSLKDDDESRVEMDMSPNAKIEALRQVVLDMPPDAKFLVFYQFHHSGKKVRTLLDELKVPWATLYGRGRMAADGLKQEGQFARFRDEPVRRCRALVLQNQAGSEAINPHRAAHWLWFYERPASAITSQQAEKRINRLGQPHPCFIGDLVMLGTVEEALLEYVKDSRDIRQAVYRGEVVL